ncbi:hypothetical protein FK178_05745 [Antarcticibacterium arcticum]|uniref:Lipocalin-like domain-containing protein n=1 Tax=Antarcticibacterium arcticum TaxID=2585771 RepID=A0A5B8YKT3_9FLAO|nr:hypothetical protein [Antarcticibacterium arcticum]QED37243.1 hypothetical protein FK178_05745 [Antarcticibacterium arcticum]
MKKLIFIALVAISFTSCSPKLVGTWNIDKYEVDNQKGQNFTTRNAGELILKKNGTGEKKVEYNMFQNEFSDMQSFRWSMQGENIININSTDSRQKSDFDKTWIMVTNTKKKQVWKSTDGKNTVQVLEMTKRN